MPSSININGQVKYRPAVYAEIDASALGGQNASTGNVCLVGSFPTFEQNVPYVFTSTQGMVRYDHSDRELAHIGRVSFAPSLDERIPAGANTLTMLNVAPCTQASTTVVDEDGAGSLVLKSKVWGTKGNRTQVSIENDNTDQVNIRVVRDGVVETYEGIESDVVASVYYSGSALDVVEFEADRASGSVEYRWKAQSYFTGQNNDLDFTAADLADMVIGSSLTLTLDDTSYSAGIDIMIEGEDMSGASVVFSGTFAQGAYAPIVTTVEFSKIIAITSATTALAYGGVLTVIGSKALNVSDFNTLSEIISTLDQYPNVVATYLSAKEYDADAFDAVLDTDISGASDAAQIRCDLAEILSALSSSRLISAERATGSRKSIKQQLSGSNDESYMLTGGTQSAVSLTDWTNALQNVESSDIQIMVAWDDDIDVHGEFKAHLRNAALAGRERNAWFGASSNETLTQLNARTKSTKMNDRNMALVGQHVKLVDPSGKTVTREPKWLALMLACMQAGSPVATPLTRKQPDVVDVLGSWDSNKDAESAIKAGVCSLSLGPFGWRVERSVTTWLRDDNPIYSEVSANESINASVRDLRLGLDSFIGTANQGVTANRIKSIVESRLNSQVFDGVIKSFKDVVLEDLGDTLNVHYTVAAVEPINFIRIVASVARF